MSGDRAKVVFVQQNAAFGATEEYLLDLMLGIDRTRFQVSLICPAHPALRPFRELNRDDVQVIILPTDSFTSGGVKGMAAVWRALQQLHPNIAHFNDPCPRGLIAATLAGVPVRVMTHHTPELNRHYNWRGRLMESFAFRTRLAVIFTSEPSRQLGAVRDRLPPERSVVIPYGLRPEWLEEPDASARQEVRSELGIHDGEFLILNAARLSPQKAHSALLKAAGQILARRQDVKFAIAGEGESRREIEAQIRSAGVERHFRLLGFRSDIRRLMTGADLFVMPSHFEGLCKAVQEASATGLAVVASNVGGLRFSVADGETGVLIPPNHSSALAKAIDDLLSDSPRRLALGKAGRERAMRLFSLHKMINDTESLYESLLKPPRA